ncbi:MAG: electron transport complex subunit RsxC [Clostridia bacterium]|nr:electron transport complex subunit RsxC [Clostridia bacterium]
MAFTFRGGVHLNESKNTAASAIRHMPAPAKVSIPLSQHIGAHCKPTVKVGDEVMRGQVIGAIDAGLGCPVHSSVSGKVKAIEEKYNAMGVKVANIVIESDGLNTLSPDVRPYEKELEDITFDDLIEVVKNAGISGMGGATFPTYAKISSARGKVDRLIVNCAECEPYITANHRLLLERPESVIGGMKLMLKVFGLKQGDLAIEDNKRDAIKIAEGMTAENDLIKVRVLKTKYPQGDERQLIYALTGREIPAGGLPADVGCIVFNAETCSAIYNAFVTGMPLIERVVTVDGDCVVNPSNVLAPIGTSYRDLVEFCGGFKAEPEKVVNGGPMMGAAQWDLDAPVTKGTSAILVFSDPKPTRYEQPSACIHCGRCVGVCQMHLMPNYLSMFSRAGKWDLCEKYNVMSCVECGACSYICPGGVSITADNRVAKAKINEKRRAQKAAQAAAAAQKEAK